MLLMATRATPLLLRYTLRHIVVSCCCYDITAWRGGYCCHARRQRVDMATLAPLIALLRHYIEGSRATLKARKNIIPHTDIRLRYYKILY